MKKLKYILTAYVGLLALTSCFKLESEEYSTIDPGFFPKTEEDAFTLVTTCYRPFRCEGYGGIYSSAQGGIHVMGDMSTDIGDCQWGADPWQAAVMHNWTPDNWAVIGNYYKYYREISRFTIAIDRVSKINFKDENYKKRLIAEVHCAKGFMGYLLYDWFGPVPVAALEQLKDPLGDVQIPRLSEEEMIKFIEDELNEAIKVLPAKYDAGEYGRFTKGTAYTVLLKLKMLTKKWDEVVKIADELAKPEYGYSLVPSYKNIFTLENEGNSEIIHAATCTLNIPSLWLAHVLPGGFPTKNPNIQKWNGYRMLWSFYDKYEPTDKRLETINAEFSVTDENGVKTTYNRANPQDKFAKGAIPIKVGEDPASTGEASSIDWVVFRYADVLLLKAEAMVRRDNAVSQNAVDLLNMIRARAGVSQYSQGDFPNATKFLEVMLDERGRELYFEGARRSDLIRYGKYIEYARTKGSLTTQEHFTRMPIPQSAINEGKGKVVQNPGY